jgi:hypothetical protein
VRDHVAAAEAADADPARRVHLLDLLAGEHKRSGFHSDDKRQGRHRIGIGIASLSGAIAQVFLGRFESELVQYT